MSGSDKKYDLQRKARAGTSAGLRGLVAAYLIYLGWKIASGSLTGNSPIPEWAGVLVGGLFILVAVGFGVYIVRRYLRDLKAAELPEEQENQEELSE